MGGKPYTSRGCQNCRRRKVKCDEQRPQCQTCIRRDTQCPGYERDNGVFIHHKNNDHDRDSRTAKKQKHNPPSALQIQTKPLGQQAARAQIFACFYSMYFPKNGYVSRVNTWHFLIGSFQDGSQKGRMLDKAVFAVAALYVGKMRNDFQVFSHGQRVYNEAIFLLRNKIQGGSYDSDIIYTTLIFQEIEQFHRSRDLEAYFAHLDGMKRILNYYRPWMVNDRFANHIYCTQPRLTMYLASAGVIKEPVGEYEAVLPITEFKVYSQFLELLDAVISFAGVIASAIRSETCETDIYDSILDHSVKLEAQLETWFTQSGLGKSYTHALPNEIFTAKLPASDPLFGRAYQFDTIDSAILHTWKFECMIRIMKLTLKARTRIGPDRSTANSAEDDAVQVDMLDSEGLQKLEYYADQIFLAIPFCAHDDMGTFGLRSLDAPMWTAAQIYVDLGKREKFFWCQKAMQVSADRLISTAAYFAEIGWKRFREKEQTCNSGIPSEDSNHRQTERVVDVSEKL